MCGIFGYIGPKNSADICLNGLKTLEYRGYDSAGIVGTSGGTLVGCKEVGKIAVLEQTLTNSPLHLDAAIAHTRWATHGKPSIENAHPHYDTNKDVAIVHNGIIENHYELKEMLMTNGFDFSSDTDTEVIAHLIAFFNEGDLLSAVHQALTLLEGFWAIAVVHKDHPDQIIAAAKESPLCIGQTSSRAEVFISSDPNAFHGQELDIMFLKSGEIALVTTAKVTVFDASFSPIVASTKRFKLDSHSISKGNYPHYMLKEIMEQPQTIQQALHNRMIDSFGTAEFESLSLTPKELLSVGRILILACGTSWHAGCIAASLLEEIARIPCEVDIASEFRYKNPIISDDTLVLAISQSGETLDTISAVREVKNKGAKVLGFCNVPHSTLSREADACLHLRAGPEISVCSTKAYTSQLTVLSLFTLHMARLRHMSKESGQEFLQGMRALSTTVERVLELRPTIQKIAKKYSQYGHFFFLGRHYMYATALEAALKLKEITYLFAQGYPSGEMKHGPIALINENVPVIGLCGNRATYEKTLSNLQESKSRGAPILAFAPENAPRISQVADDVIYIPEVVDPLASIPYSVACQLFAYEMAVELGHDIDKPRNLAKSVTVE